MDVGWLAGFFKVTAAKLPRDLLSPACRCGSAVNQGSAGTGRVVTLRARCPDKNALDPCQLLHDSSRLWGVCSGFWDRKKPALAHLFAHLSSDVLDRAAESKALRGH
jgi:hypothetical protein